MEKQKESEMKENFYQKIKSQLLAKGLVVADLQKNIREENVDAIAELIGKDWYTFGKYMKVEESTLDHIKEVGGSKLGRKKKLLEYCISKKLRYEDIIYGLYNSSDEHNPSINGVLDYLLTQRESEDPKSNERQSSKQRRPRSKLLQQQDVPWQAIFEERQLNQPKLTKSQGHLTPETYADHFFEMLWLEENEHMKKLEEKCDGANYKLTIYDSQNVPLHLLQNPLSYYGYISDKEFTDDKIEYATQASDRVTIVGRDGIFVAYKHSYNFNHLENRMYIVAHNTQKILQALRRGSKVEDGREINVRAEFEVKHSYFDHLQHAVVIAPDYIKRCLLPDAMSFSSLFLMFGLQYSRSFFMKLDENNQLKALRMITSDSSQPSPLACPPPVILYGPYGSGKTRIL
ncbi:PREDICTED: uncharacterized protein LOC109592696, partial [Amphimedon queenslandica]|uniref:Uncharacterized protein n=2 Tax=Amphimedon queenslandica TaxID=400682 RepID=A0AAN0K3B7_AMPQE